MAKWGEYNSAQLKPTWESKTKAGNDKTGWKRGGIGIDGLYDLDGRDYMKTADPAADREFFGPTTNQRRVDGAMKSCLTPLKTRATSLTTGKVRRTSMWQAIATAQMMAFADE